MLMPTLWNRRNDVFDVMDPFADFGHVFDALWGNGLESTVGMKTDVIDEGANYRLEAELPGFHKEDISVDLKDDTLTISATHGEDKDEKDNDGKYIRRERRFASYQRSFRVENLQPEDIQAEYKNGVLSVVIPKKEAIEQKEEAKRIEVKG